MIENFKQPGKGIFKTVLFISIAWQPFFLELCGDNN